MMEGQSFQVNGATSAMAMKGHDKQKTKTTKYFALLCKRGFQQESSTLESSLASKMTRETED